MAHPKRQHSKQRSRKRRTGNGLSFSTSIDLKASRVGTQNGVNHRVDPDTGMYKGKLVVDLTPKQKKSDEQQSQ